MTRGKDGIWFVVQTNPNCERKAVVEIRRAGFRAYMPVFARDFRHHRTKKLDVQRRPLLVGYVFMRFPGPANWYALRQCQGVKGVLYCDGRPYELPNSAIAALMREQRAMAHDTRDARTLRRAKLTGERHALAKEKFQPGRKIFQQGSGIIARVIAVTKRGTVEAIVESKGRDLPIEFRDTDGLVVLDAA